MVHSPGPASLPPCWLARPQRASQLGAQYSAVSPPPGQGGSRSAHPFPPLCLSPWMALFSLPPRQSPPPLMSLCLCILALSWIVLEAPPLPGSPTPQQHWQSPKCQAAPFLPNGLTTGGAQGSRYLTCSPPTVMGWGCWKPLDQVPRRPACVLCEPSAGKKARCQVHICGRKCYGKSSCACISRLGLQP